jgi:hypothetical protein
VAEIAKGDLEKLAALLDRVPPLPAAETLTAEEDENGVVFLTDKNGAPVMMMSRADYEAIRTHKDRT